MTTRDAFPPPSPAPETLAIHAGQEPDPTHGAVMPSIVLSTTFEQPEPGKPLRYDYSRSGNPTRAALEECVAALEGGRFGFAFSSGCAAATTLLHTLSPGDHVLCGNDVYGGTYRIFRTVLEPFGIRASFIDQTDPAAFARAIEDRTRLIWIESPTNPLLKLSDIRELAGLARTRGIGLVVDNTFASPILQNPLKLGATVVLHSTTKYINGHSDVVGGALVTNDEKLAERLKFLQNAMGGVPSPFDCYLVLRGIKTLPVRMQRTVESATELSRRLAEHPGIEKVHYPGLASHPQHDICKKQMRGGGGIITLEVEGGLRAAKTFLTSLRWFSLAESLGGVESLAEHPGLMTHSSIPKDVREALGITDGLIRLSIGLEHVEDLWRDLEASLAAAARGEK